MEVREGTKGGINLEYKWGDRENVEGNQKTSRFYTTAPFPVHQDLLDGVFSALGAPVIEGLQIATTAMGAWGFVGLFELKSLYGLADANAEFRNILRQLLR